MRVIIVIPFLSNGGAERMAAKWCYDLVEKGINANILVHYRIENEYDIASKIPIEALFDSKQEYNASSKVKTILKIRSYLKEQGNHLYIIPFIPHIGLQCTLANLGLNNYLIETIRAAPQFSPQNKIFRVLRNISVYLANGCIFQNKEQMDYFPNKVRNRGIIISNTVPKEFLEKFDKKEYKEIKNIIMVSRLTKQKNHLLMLNALSALKKRNYSFLLTIVGDGPEFNYIKNMIQELKLEDCVLLYGRSNNVGELLVNSDLYVLTSNFEGMPNSLMEAMSCGLPCISTACPTGPNDLIDDKKNGILIDTNDLDGLIKSIIFCSENKEYFENMGHLARKKIIEINSENTTDKLIKYLKKLS